MFKFSLNVYNVIKWSSASRLIVIFVQVMPFKLSFTECFTHTFIVYLFIQILATKLINEHNADAFKLNLFQNKGGLNNWIKFGFSGFTKWDSMYFLSIAQNGYNFDQTLAFFPLFPAIIKYCAYILTLQTQYSILLLLGVVLNQIFFVLSSIALYFLSFAILKDTKVSLQVIKYYSFNPASIFFSSFYSESLFSFLSFTSYLLIVQSKLFLASILIGLSSLTRSNGLISLGYLLFNHWSYLSITIKGKNKSDKSKLIQSLMIITKALIQSFIVCSLFITFQLFSYHLICTTPKSDEDSNWCQSLLPLPYSYIQKKYWNVGLLNYWQFKKIPNFILALPIFIISFYTIINYVHFNYHRMIHLLVPVKAPVKRKVKFWINVQCFPFIVHLAFLIIFCFLFIHIEVTTRLIMSTCPAVYWSVVSMSKQKQQYIQVYFAFYFLTGIVLHSNFYPWT